MYLRLEGIVSGETVLSELHCILLEVAFMNCTNALSLLTNYVKSEVCVMTAKMVPRISEDFLFKSCRRSLKNQLLVAH